MASTDQTITITRGDDLTVLIPVLDEDGANLDLSGGTARWWVGKTVNSTGANVLIDKSTADVTMTITSASGLYTLTIPIEPADTEALEAGNWYHEAEVITSGGLVYTVTTGTFALGADLVRTA